MCGNPNGVKFNRELTAMNLSFHLASMTLIVFVTSAGWFGKIDGFTPMLANHKKGIFLLKRAFFGEIQSPLRWLSNQISSFKLEAELFYLTAANIYVTL